jgi:hypothetical protein
MHAEAEGGMRCAFPPYGAATTLLIDKAREYLTIWLIII